MSFELLPEMTYWFIGYVAIAAIALTVGLGAFGVTLAEYRKDRVARHESIPAYYRRLALSH